jgi:hypothetical protein
MACALLLIKHDILARLLVVSAAFVAGACYIG